MEALLMYAQFRRMKVSVVEPGPPKKKPKEIRCIERIKASMLSSWIGTPV
jgi:hypothetical protein